MLSVYTALQNIDAGLKQYRSVAYLASCLLAITWLLIFWKTRAEATKAALHRSRPQSMAVAWLPSEECMLRGVIRKDKRSRPGRSGKNA